MPIALDTRSGDVWTLTTGEHFTLAETTALMEKTEWRRGVHYLWDLRQLRRGPSSTDELRELANFSPRLQPLFRGSRSAVLVHRDVDFGLARMFDAYASDIGVDYRIFRDEQEALAWLRSPPDDAPER